jgi:hypothetical protein
MLLVLLQAAEEAEPNQTAFYVLAGILTAFAVVLAIVGTLRHETFPPSRGVATAIMLVCALLVAGTMVTAVVTA